MLLFLKVLDLPFSVGRRRLPDHKRRIFIVLYYFVLLCTVLCCMVLYCTNGVSYCRLYKKKNQRLVLDVELISRHAPLLTL